MRESEEIKYSVIEGEGGRSSGGGGEIVGFYALLCESN